jgi:hypothetical protein
MIPAGKNLTISDAQGVNTLQLAPGLAITSSQVFSTAVKLTLANGSTVTVLGADKFFYDVGGNTTVGIDNPDITFKSFVEGTLGVTVPVSGLSNGGSLVIGSISPASLLAATAAGSDFVVAQYASPNIIGAGAGDDTYLISSALLPAGLNLTISDATGNNSIQLADGLKIIASQVSSSALKLTLDSGATVTILGANKFTYDVGGNTTAGVDQADVSYAQLVTDTLGATLPVSGISSGGPVTIGGSTIPVVGNQTVTATAARETFYFDAVVALADIAGTNTQATLAGFATTGDVLKINLPTANPAITWLSQLDGQQGVSVQTDPFAQSTLINFGTDSNGNDTVALTLAGITDPSLVKVQIV